MKTSILGLGIALIVAFVLNLIFSQFDLSIYGIVIEEIMVSQNNDIGLLGSTTFIAYSTIRSLFVFGVPGFLLPIITKKPSFLHAAILVLVFILIQSLPLLMGDSHRDIDVFILNSLLILVFTSLGVVIGNKWGQEKV
ncbi:MAG: hypothetical protein ABW148_18285 [Sedimenticola sp.]